MHTFFAPAINLTVALSALITVTANAADLPTIPTEAIGVKKELLFSDDFSKSDYGEAWHKVVPTFTFENGTLKGVQTRLKDEPSADGKSTTKAHAAVIGHNIPTKDSIITCKFRFDGSSNMSVQFDDRAFKGSHYGHICRVVMTPTTVTIIDERDGSMDLKIKEMALDPSKKAERSKMLIGRSATFPTQISNGEWHELSLETIGEAMRATIDGKPVAYLKSSGIGHATKSKIELGVAGKDGYFDDVGVWNAEPAP